MSELGAFRASRSTAQIAVKNCIKRMSGIHFLNFLATHLAKMHSSNLIHLMNRRVHSQFYRGVVFYRVGYSSQLSSDNICFSTFLLFHSSLRRGLLQIALIEELLIAYIVLLKIQSKTFHYESHFFYRPVF